RSCAPSLPCLLSQCWCTSSRCFVRIGSPSVRVCLPKYQWGRRCRKLGVRQRYCGSGEAGSKRRPTSARARLRSKLNELLRSPWPCLSAGCIEGDRGTDERLERARVDVLPLMDVNRAPYVPVEARVEELGRVLQRTPLGEGELHFGLGRLAAAGDPVVR